MTTGTAVDIVDDVLVLDDDSIRLLLTEAAGWHRTAQLSMSAGDHNAARYAYRMRETLARYIAARSHLGFHEARARAIVISRRLD